MLYQVCRQRVFLFFEWLQIKAARMNEMNDESGDAEPQQVPVMAIQIAQ